MLGAIIGDIIGSFYEWNNVKTEDFDLFPKEATFTDDTVMTLAVAKWLIEDINHTDAGLVKTMQELGRKYPNAGYGGHFYDWIFSDNPQPYNSWGNGSAMRVGPVGFAANNIEDTLHLAEVSAAVTHNHPEGIKGAQAIAACVFYNRTLTGNLNERKQFIKDYVERSFGYNLSRSLDEVRLSYKFDVSCQGSVPEAIIAFLEAETLEDCARKAVSLGGDSDTIAAMACSIFAAGEEGMFPPSTELYNRCQGYLSDDLRSIIEQFDFGYVFSHEDNNSMQRLQKIALPIGTKIVNNNDPYFVYQITGILEQEVYGIVYSARKYFVGNGNADICSMDYVEVRIHECFYGSRGTDGVQVLQSARVADGLKHSLFYDSISKVTKLSSGQVLQLFHDGGDPDFFQANGTEYFVQYENGNTRLRIGSVFAHKGTQYQADAICGKGSYGRVWRMKRIHQSLQTKISSMFSSDWTKHHLVAVKQFSYVPVLSLQSTLRQSETAFRDFRLGFLAHFQLSHPNIAKAYAFLDIFDVPSYAMEYIEGSSLKEYVDRNGCMSEKEARAIVSTIVKAIKYCHDQGVHHGDLKPNNVMITSEGTIKLIDLGFTTHCPDIVGISRVYFYLLTGVYLSTRKNILPTQEVMEQIAAILYERKVSDVVKSHILNMLEGYNDNDRTLDFVLRSIENNTPMPLKVTRYAYRMPESTWEDCSVWCNPRSKKQRADIPSYQFYKFEQNGLLGMKNRQGEIVIPPIYSVLSEIGNYHIPGPGPTSGWDIVGVKSYRLGLIGWHKIVNDNQMILEIELTDEKICELRMLT